VDGPECIVNLLTDFGGCCRRGFEGPASGCSDNSYSSAGSGSAREGVVGVLLVMVYYLLPSQNSL
jgi:hypothetical protein